MTNSEGIEMMNRCINEIGALKAQIERLRPKADAYDNIAIILRLLPQQGQAMGEDLVWALKLRIRELTPPTPES